MTGCLENNLEINPAEHKDGSAPLSILIVDDEIHMVDELVEAFSFEGYSVKGVTSPRLAQDILSKDKNFAVMISDIRMPECDGITLSNTVLKNRNDLDALEIILVTGHGLQADAEAELRSHSFSFVRKPFLLDEIFTVAQAALERASARRAHAQKN